MFAWLESDRDRNSSFIRENLIALSFSHESWRGFRKLSPPNVAEMKTLKEDAPLMGKVQSAMFEGLQRSAKKKERQLRGHVGIRFPAIAS